MTHPSCALVHSRFKLPLPFILGYYSSFPHFKKNIFILQANHFCLKDLNICWHNFIWNVVLYFFWSLLNLWFLILFSLSFFFKWSIVDLQYFISFRCTTYWSNIFIDCTPFKVTIKYWLCYLCYTIYSYFYPFSQS